MRSTAAWAFGREGNAYGSRVSTMLPERPYQAAAQQLVGAVQLHRHVGAGDVEFLRDLGDRPLVEIPHPYDIGVTYRRTLVTEGELPGRSRPPTPLDGPRLGSLFTWPQGPFSGCHFHAVAILVEATTPDGVREPVTVHFLVDVPERRYTARRPAWGIGRCGSWGGATACSAALLRQRPPLAPPFASEVDCRYQG